MSGHPAVAGGLSPSSILALQRAVGNRAVGRLLRQSLGETEHRVSDFAHFTSSARSVPPGFRHTGFGDYWVLREDGNSPPGAARGEPIRPAAFLALQSAWDLLGSGQGQLTIDENGQAGFRPRVLGMLGRLISRPRGRALVLGLLYGRYGVSIRARDTPVTREEQDAEASPLDPTGARPAEVTIGSPSGGVGMDISLTVPGGHGTGSGAVVQLDPRLRDEDMLVSGQAGRPIADPVFILLGHELIHARHYAQGESHSATSEFPTTEPQDPHGYTNAEEENTIAHPWQADEVTENSLRAEWQLPSRVGHGGVDLRLHPRLRGQQFHFPTGTQH